MGGGGVLQEKSTKVLQGNPIVGSWEVLSILFMVDELIIFWRITSNFRQYKLNPGVPPTQIF